jgi:DMSO reductase anchor subunit
MVGNPEYTLVIPTIFLHMSIGATFILALMKLTSKEFFSSSEGVVVEKQVIFFSLIIAAISMVMALSHLGHPLGAWQMIFKNLPSSWLGWETLFYLLFFISVFNYFFSLVTKGSASNGAALFTMITGGLAILTGSLIYANMGSVQAWTGAMTIVTFVVTFLLLGAAFFSLLLAGRLCAPAGPQTPVEKTFGATTKLMLVLIVVTFIVALTAGNGGEMLMPRLFLGALIPIALLLAAMSIAGKKNFEKVLPCMVGLLMFLLVGEIMGRIMFYSTAALGSMSGNGTLY